MASAKTKPTTKTKTIKPKATPQSPLVEEIMIEHKDMMADKQQYLSSWQEVGEYIRLRKQDFTSIQAKGSFYTDDIYDTTAVQASRAAQSALLGQLWPSGARTVKIVSSEEKPSQDEKDFFQWQTRKLIFYMEMRKARLIQALSEVILDLITLGVCGLSVEKTKDPAMKYIMPLRYVVWDLQNISIKENVYGEIDTVHAEYEYTASEMVDLYGHGALPSKVKEDIRNNKSQDAKYSVLIAFRPRRNRGLTKKGVKDKPVGVYHIFKATKELLKESGLDKLPTNIARMGKVAGQTYTSPMGMEALPLARQANAQREALIRAAEKQLDPPLMLMDADSLGAGVVDSSAGALNVFDFNARIPTDNPLRPLFTVGELRSMQEALAATQQEISQHFMIDRLLDFNNETRMTLGETQIRAAIRGESLAAVHNGLISETLEPTVQDSYNHLFEDGFLGIEEGDSRRDTLEKNGVEIKVIPQSVMERIKSGRDVYNIHYISPAMRMMNKERVASAMTTLETAGTYGQLFPEMIAAIDGYETIKTIVEGTGGDEVNLRAKETAEAMVQNQMAAAAQNQQIENIDKAASAAQKGAQAEATLNPRSAPGG